MKKRTSHSELEKKITFLEQENKQLKNIQHLHQNTYSDKLKHPGTKSHQEINHMQKYYEIINSTSEVFSIRSAACIPEAILPSSINPIEFFSII